MTSVIGEKISICQGCGNEGPLCKSHIIPEWAYVAVYTPDHKFVAISETNSGTLELEQKGYREYLLCKTCENRLSTGEEYLRDLILEIKAGGGKHTSISHKGARAREFVIDDPILFKKTLLSILWRMDITKQPVFAEYNLGPYRKKMHTLIWGPSVSSEWWQFPICAFNITRGETGLLDVLMVYKRGRYKNHTMYSFCLHGVSFWVVIADHYQENDDALPLVSLKSNGKIAIADITLWEEMRQSKLGNRVLDQDVIGFFKAHQQSAVD